MIRTVRNAFIIGLMLVFCSINGNAQNTNINPATVNVEALSDAQIERLIAEMEKNGMSMEEAMTLARARGASQSQIDQMVQRINEIKNNGGAKASTALMQEKTL